MYATSETVPEISSFFIKSIDRSQLSLTEKKALFTLKNWNGNFGKEEVGPVLYNRLWYEFSKNTFQDEMGTAFKQFMNTPFEEKAIASQVKREKSIWWDDVATTNVIESKEDIMLKSFRNSITFLKEQLGENIDDWKWSRVVQLEHEHAIGKAGGLLRSIFNYEYDCLSVCVFLAMSFGTFISSVFVCIWVCFYIYSHVYVFIFVSVFVARS